MAAVVANTSRRLVLARAVKPTRISGLRTTLAPCWALRQNRFSLRANAVPVCRASVTESERADQKPLGLPSIFQNFATTAMITALAVALALGVPSAAEAARSGGRAGGSHFSSHSRSSSSSHSSSSGGHMGGSLGGHMGGGRSYSTYSTYSAPAVTYVPSVVVPVGPTVGVGYYDDGSSTLIVLFTIAVVALAAISMYTSYDTDVAGAVEQEVSVMKVQVGLLGVARSLKDNLDSIASKADTSDSEGLNFLLQEAALALLRNPDYYVYGASSCEILKDSYSAEKAYNKASMEERSKFREETFSNVGGVKRRRAMKSKESGVNELMVVTMVIAAEGRNKLPPVRSAADLRSCLNYIAAIGASKLIGVELLWTPEAEGDFYTRDEVIADYPNLVPLV